jgi:hypothetical protein
MEVTYFSETSIELQINTHRFIQIDRIVFILGKCGVVQLTQDWVKWQSF